MPSIPQAEAPSEKSNHYGKGKGTMSFLTVGELIEELEVLDPEKKICIRMQEKHRIYATVGSVEEHDDEDDLLVIIPGWEAYSAQSLFK